MPSSHKNSSHQEHEYMKKKKTLFQDTSTIAPCSPEHLFPFCIFPSSVPVSFWPLVSGTLGTYSLWPSLLLWGWGNAGQGMATINDKVAFEKRDFECSRALGDPRLPHDQTFSVESYAGFLEGYNHIQKVQTSRSPWGLAGLLEI